MGMSRNKSSLSHIVDGMINLRPPIELRYGTDMACMEEDW